MIDIEKSYKDILLGIVFITYLKDTRVGALFI